MIIDPINKIPRIEQIKSKRKVEPAGKISNADKTGNSFKDSLKKSVENKIPEKNKRNEKGQSKSERNGFDITI